MGVSSILNFVTAFSLNWTRLCKKQQNCKTKKTKKVEIVEWHGKQKVSEIILQVQRLQNGLESWHFVGAIVLVFTR